MGLSLVGSPLVVYADEFTYIPITDVDQYNSYRFFENYGWSMDYTNTVTYTTVTSGTFSYTGVVNGTILGSQSNSFTISLTGQLDNLEDGTYLLGYETGGIISTPLGVLSMELVPQDSAYESNIVTACHAVGASQYPASNGTRYPLVSTWECSDGGGYEAPSYDVVLNSLGLSTNNTAAYEICLSETQSGGGSLSGTISLNESMTTSGSGTISLDSTTSTTGHKTYNLPILTVTNVNNDYIASKRIKAYYTDPYHIAYMTSTTTNLNGKITMHNVNTGYQMSGYTVTTTSYNGGGFILYDTKISSDTQSGLTYIKFNNLSNYAVVPIYVGNESRMNDDLFRLLNGSDISNAVDNSQNTTSNFIETSDQYHDIEDTFNDDMNNSLNNISTTSDLMSNNKFLNTANWVKVQFERLVLNTPFEYIIVYCLILGIALVLIGKVR